ncbi:hypothetical protein HWV62_24762 [Athelia sp. TMB]|nr:hypothetical protein HWV62_24762 [Athelia sp. TMB]
MAQRSTKGASRIVSTDGDGAEDEAGAVKIAKVIKGKRGKLKQLTEMPLDILYEVSRFLDADAETTPDARLVSFGRYSSMYTPMICSVFPERPRLYAIVSCADPRERGAPRVHPKSCVIALAEKIHALQPDSGKITAFLAEERRKIDILYQHGTRCENWQLHGLVNRAEELQDLRKARREAIAGNLRDLGYGAELDSNTFINHPLVNKPQELTDRVWSNIKPNMIEIMHTIRHNRSRTIRVNAINHRLGIMQRLLEDYKKAQPRDAILPEVADIFNLPVCRALILNSADDQNRSAKDFEHIKTQLPQLCQQWRANADAELLRLLTHSKGTKLDELKQLCYDSKQLELATTQFHCQDCGIVSKAIGYPRILAHRCLTYARALQPDPDDDDGIMWKWNFPDNRKPWSMGLGEKVFYAEKVAAVVRCLLVICKLDPDSTTAQEMDRRDLRFECEICRSNYDGALMMTWRRAVLHCAEHEEQKWKIAGEADSAKVKEQEKTDHFVLSCCHCKENQYARKMEGHLREVHNINEMSKADYFMHPDYPSVVHAVRLLSPSQMAWKQEQLADALDAM